MPDSDYITINGVDIPKEPALRNQYQRGLVQGYRAGLERAGKDLAEYLKLRKDD